MATAIGSFFGLIFIAAIVVILVAFNRPDVVTFVKKDEDPEKYAKNLKIAYSAAAAAGAFGMIGATMFSSSSGAMRYP